MHIRHFTIAEILRIGTLLQTLRDLGSGSCFFKMKRNLLNSLTGVSIPV